MEDPDEKKRLIKYVQTKLSLNVHDKHSLMQALNSFTEFGKDAQKYFSALKVPDTILYWYLRALVKFKFPVRIVREADRYKWMLHLCIQQNWAAMKDVFEHTKFIKIKKGSDGLMMKNTINQDAYKEALDKILEGKSFESIVELLKQKSHDLKYFVIYKNDKDTIVIGYDKPSGKFRINGGASNINGVYTFDKDVSLNKIETPGKVDIFGDFLCNIIPLNDCVDDFEDI